FARLVELSLRNEKMFLTPEMLVGRIHASTVNGLSAFQSVDAATRTRPLTPSSKRQAVPNFGSVVDICAPLSRVTVFGDELSSVVVVAPSVPSKPRRSSTSSQSGSATISNVGKPEAVIPCSILGRTRSHAKEVRLVSGDDLHGERATWRDHQRAAGRRMDREVSVGRNGERTRP